MGSPYRRNCLKWLSFTDAFFETQVLALASKSKGRGVSGKKRLDLNRCGKMITTPENEERMS